jgi:hypothetical protein
MMITVVDTIICKKILQMERFYRYTIMLNLFFYNYVRLYLRFYFKDIHTENGVDQSQNYNLW